MLPLFRREKFIEYAVHAVMAAMRAILGGSGGEPEYVIATASSMKHITAKGRSGDWARTWLAPTDRIRS